MKSVVLIRAAQNLERREKMLRKRYLSPVLTATTWTPELADHAAAYIGLLHSEAEYTLEAVVRLVLANSRQKTIRHLPDQVLLNCCAHFRNEMHATMGSVEIVPKRKELAQDATRLVDTWDNLGASKYFDMIIDKNHGAGVDYLARLLHPLGIVVDPKGFKRFESSGVKPVVTWAGSETMMTEFVLLRGSAMHAGTKRFGAAVQNISPSVMKTRGEGVVSFVRDLCRLLARRVW